MRNSRCDLLSNCHCLFPCPVAVLLPGRLR
uniref:Uncharacterized protein n=1 Tax=Siphoviridae sp. ctvBz3 TaxID=2825720 RepID=A0A8S5TXI0_9CAUD|nr:MAG TPA: hypothetical protein [Siphoviridae sp. ctvBz3]